MTLTTSSISYLDSKCRNFFIKLKPSHNGGPTSCACIKISVVVNDSAFSFIESVLVCGRSFVSKPCGEPSANNILMTVNVNSNICALKIFLYSCP